MISGDSTVFNSVSPMAKPLSAVLPEPGAPVVQYTIEPGASTGAICTTPSAPTKGPATVAPLSICAPMSLIFKSRPALCVASVAHISFWIVYVVDVVYSASSLT